MELKEKIIAILKSNWYRTGLPSWGKVTDKILEQVEASYISKEEHDKILRVNARTRKQLCERIKELKANSIPKDRVREKLEVAKKREWKITKAGYYDGRIDLCVELLGES